MVDASPNKKSGKEFAFEADAQKLAFTDVNSERYVDYTTELSKEDLIQIIMSNVEQMQNDIKNDVCDHSFPFHSHSILTSQISFVKMPNL